MLIIAHKHKYGFTLIELSIVLVIIGLIVGGILVGRDLIRASEIRATIGQYEKFNTAVNIFRSKYAGLPGDLSSTDALSFGLFCLGGTPSTCTGGTGLGNGNGQITEAGGTSARQYGGETVIFWRQLSDANMIEGSYGAGSIITQSSGLINTFSTDKYFPSSKMGGAVYWLAGSYSGANYYMLTIANVIQLGQDLLTGSGGVGGSGGIAPNDAYSIDIKIDDGMPNTGNVQARGTAAFTGTLFPTLNAVGAFSNYGKNNLEGSEAVGDCTVTPASVGAADPLSTFNTYSRVLVSGNVQACNLRFKFQ